MPRDDRAVPAFLVTGHPGSGKSELARELAHRGFRAIDPDYDPELSFWRDDAGNQVAHGDGPALPDEEWLRSHRWIWSRSRMEERLAGAAEPALVCGIALNIVDVLDLFDAIFLLHIDQATQEARLAAHDAANPPGRTEAGRQEIRVGRETFEAEVVSLGAVVLDGTAPTTAVADELLAVVAI